MTGPLTLGAFLEDAALKYPNRPAATDGDGIYTYSKLCSLSGSLAAELEKRGVARGTHVGIWCGDSVWFLAAFFALARIGAPAVLMNTVLGAHEIEAALKASDTQYLLYGDGYKDMDFRGVCAELAAKGGRQYIYLGEAVALAEKNGGSFGGEGPRESDTATMLFTSGTSGSPKCVLTSHRSWVFNAGVQAKSIAATMEDRFCVSLPMYHCFGLCAGVLAAVAVGACACFPENRRTRSLLDTISSRKCTVLNGVPTLFDALLGKEYFKDYDVSSLRVGLIGGDTYTEERFMRISRLLDFRLMPSLGMTEATGIVSAAEYDDDIKTLATTLGKFAEGVEGRLADVSSGADVGTWQIGEILIRGEGLMQGYYKDEALTAKLIDRNGFFHTGDTAYLDGRGYLHFAGRIKDLIIRGGENISPDEIERAVEDSPLVEQAVVVGVPDSHYGEQVCACVVLKEGASPDRESILKTASRSLSDFKMPEFVLFYDKIPRKSSGKTDMAELRRSAALRVKNL